MNITKVVSIIHVHIDGMLLFKMFNRCSYRYVSHYQNCIYHRPYTCGMFPRLLKEIAAHPVRVNGWAGITSADLRCHSAAGIMNDSTLIDDE